ncbi:MAG: nickel pincer cofactor biosynthesis protein LarB [Phycisphaerales bacterium]|nr:nickel pincer cofactor biosynthesis protein LarB [Phycisphaerales bacterium]
MSPETLRRLLEDVRGGSVPPAVAAERIARLPYENLSFARIDHHRSIRVGFPEVIFGQGKRSSQVVEIFARLAAAGHDVLATRVRPKTAERVCKRFADAEHNRLARTVALRQTARRPASGGYVGVVCAGTADLPVAEEARVTLEMMGCEVRPIYDVGVAGLHRLLGELDALRGARALVVCAGMEGALPSVVGGLVNIPVVAVPTSVGYGASFGGMAALLAMLNSCAPGITVVNIDNGFSAGFHAAQICRMIDQAAAGGAANSTTECDLSAATNEQHK